MGQVKDSPSIFIISKKMIDVLIIWKNKLCENEVYLINQKLAQFPVRRELQLKKNT